MIMDKILLGHGSGGRLMHSLIREYIAPQFDMKMLADPQSWMATYSWEANWPLLPILMLSHRSFFPVGTSESWRSMEP